MPDTRAACSAQSFVVIYLFLSRASFSKPIFCMSSAWAEPHAHARWKKITAQSAWACVQRSLAASPLLTLHTHTHNPSVFRSAGSCLCSPHLTRRKTLSGRIKFFSLTDLPLSQSLLAAKPWPSRRNGSTMWRKKRALGEPLACLVLLVTLVDAYRCKYAWGFAVLRVELDCSV